MWQRACAGDNDGQFYLGVKFDFGDDGLERDLPLAIRFYVLAAEQGSSSAALNLSVAYRDDLRDPQKRFFYAKMSADLGNTTGQCELAHCYEDGVGTAVNEAEALRYYQLSADQHDSSGEFCLAACYESGTCGTVENLPRALKYYKLAQQHGYDAASDIAELERQGIIAEP